ncbi:MAG: glycosyltransferase [Micropruina sp.]|nr:MAG: glycosyltransferase [Micropruina sp.]
MVFTGPRDDVPDLLAAMDCFAFPSVFEGFGLAVLEAEANGLPCVVSEAVPAEVVLDPAGGRLPSTWD